MTDNTTANLPRFLQQKESCMNCNHPETTLAYHGIDTSRPKTFVRATYVCQKCNKEFGYEYSDRFVTAYIAFRDKKQPEVIKVA